MMAGEVNVVSTSLTGQESKNSADHEEEGIAARRMWWKKEIPCMKVTWGAGHNTKTRRANGSSQKLSYRGGGVNGSEQRWIGLSELEASGSFPERMAAN